MAPVNRHAANGYCRFWAASGICCVLWSRMCWPSCRAGLIVLIHLKESSDVLVAGFTLGLLILDNRLTSYSGRVRLLLLSLALRARSHSFR